MTVSQTKPGKPPPESDTVELARFRQEWLAELQHRKAALHGWQTGNDVQAKSTTVHIAEEGPSHDRPAPLARPATRPKTHVSGIRSSDHPALVDGEVKEGLFSLQMQAALDIYGKAVEHEQRGELGEALSRYRQAFRMEDNVDRLYRRQQMLKSILNETNAKSLPLTRSEGESHAENLQPVVSAQSSTQPSNPTLMAILENLEDDLKFVPGNEEEPLFLNTVPEEMLILVLRYLDHTSIERFARVCKKARVITLDSGIWRFLVRVTYIPPQVPDLDAMLSAVERYRYDYRRLYMEYPRLRFDGVYIAICHYVRPGLSENHWVNITHLITYHRYLRFFPDGLVLSLLENEDRSPQDVIASLKPTLRKKGLYFGRWTLRGTTVHLSNLLDASGKFLVPDLGVRTGAGAGIANAEKGFGGAHHGHGGDASLSGQARYAFDMTLDLRSRPLGRWNRMDIESYDSVHLETGDVCPVALKNERPFWFSKVRSYA